MDGQALPRQEPITNPRLLRAPEILTLQRTIGNQAVLQLLRDTERGGAYQPPRPTRTLAKTTPITQPAMIQRNTVKELIGKFESGGMSTPTPSTRPTPARTQSNVTKLRNFHEQAIAKAQGKTLSTPKGAPKDKEEIDPFATLTLDIEEEEVVANPEFRRATLPKGTNYLREGWWYGDFTGKLYRDKIRDEMTIYVIMRMRLPGLGRGYNFTAGGYRRGWVAAKDVTFSKGAYEKTTEPLFPLDKSGQPRKPRMEDVRQGSFGDCFLLAAISALVARDPEYVMGMFDDRGDRVRVRLYQPHGDVGKKSNLYAALCGSGKVYPQG